MHPKSAVVLVGEARVRALRVEELEEALDVTLSVLAPFVARLGQEGLFREQGEAVVERMCRGRCMEAHSDFPQKTFEEGTELRVSGSPVPEPMGFNSLVEVPQGGSKFEPLEQAVNFVVGSGKIEILRDHGQQRDALVCGLERIAVAGKRAPEVSVGVLLVVQIEFPGSEAHQQLRARPVAVGSGDERVWFLEDERGDCCGLGDPVCRGDLAVQAKFQRNDVEIAVAMAGQEVGGGDKGRSTELRWHG